MIDKNKLYMDGLDFELIYYLEVGNKTSKGNTLYSVTLKEEDQIELFTKEVYEYFKTIAYAYGFDVMEEEEKTYTVLSRESEDFYNSYIYKVLGDAFFEVLMS